MLGGSSVGMRNEVAQLGFVLDEEGGVHDRIVTERDERVEELAFRMHLMVQQHVEGGIALGERVRAQQACIQAVVDDEIIEPGIEELAEARVEAAVRRAEGEQRVIGILRA